MKSCLQRPLLSLGSALTLESPHIYTIFFSRCNVPSIILKCFNDIDIGLYTQPQIKLHLVFIDMFSQNLDKHRVTISSEL